MTTISLVTQGFETAINWYILIPFVVFVIIMLIYLVIRNRKDETDYKKDANKEYSNPPEKEEIDNGEL